MNLDKLNKWLTLAANLGVIAGIIFLGIEISQNTDSIRATAYQTWLAANAELNRSTGDESLQQILGVANIEGSEKLSEDTYIEFAMHHFSFFQMFQTTDYLYRTGSLDPSLWESEMARAAGMLSLPGVRQWWDAGGKTQLTPQFVELIEATEPSITCWFWREGVGYFPGDCATGGAGE